MEDLSLSVPDIHCRHCKTAIEGAVGAVDGVDRAAVIIDERRVDVAFDGRPTTRAAIVEAIEGQGYVVAGAES